MGQATTSYTTIEICSNPSYQSHIDFTVPNSKFKGRLLYDFPTNEFRFNVNSSATSRMVLTDTTLKDKTLQQKFRRCRSRTSTK